MSELWQVETGEYEQRGTVFVADSPELAEKHIHTMHEGEQYKSAAWEPMKDTSWDEFRQFTVSGRVVLDSGYEYNSVYEISPIEYVKARAKVGG